MWRCQKEEGHKNPIRRISLQKRKGHNLSLQPRRQHNRRAMDKSTSPSSHLHPPWPKYLLHRLVQDPLQVPHLDAHHEGRGAADGVEQALGDHGDVGVSPREGVEESGHRVDALREDAARGQGAP